MFELLAEETHINPSCRPSTMFRWICILIIPLHTNLWPAMYPQYIDEVLSQSCPV